MTRKVTIVRYEGKEGEEENDKQYWIIQEMECI